MYLLDILLVLKRIFYESCDIFLYRLYVGLDSINKGIFFNLISADLLVFWVKIDLGSDLWLSGFL